MNKINTSISPHFLIRRSKAILVSQMFDILTKMCNTFKMLKSKPCILQTKSDKKNKALELWRKGNITKSDIARKVGVNRCTAWQWIEDETNKIKELPADKKIKIWQSESAKDLQLAGIARESLREQLEINPDKVSTDTKRAIMHSASVVAGIKWDKSRLEAGQGISGDIHAVIINMYDQRPVVDAVEVITLRPAGGGQLLPDTGDNNDNI